MSKIDDRQGERGQFLRQRTENFYAGVSVEVQYINDDSRADDREQKTQDALVGLKQKNCRECAGANCEGCPVHLSPENTFGDQHEVAHWTDAVN